MGLRKESALDFKHQVIMEYLQPGNDEVITEGTDAIIAGNKRKSTETTRIPIAPASGPIGRKKNEQKLRDVAREIQEPFRLYLRGHGDWVGKTLAGRSVAEVVGDVRILIGPVLDKVKIISITACEMARTSGANASSFASEFHKALGEGSEDMKIIPVFARTETVAVVRSGMPDVGIEGSKRTTGNGVRHQAAGTKLMFYWEGNTQKKVDAQFAKSTLLMIESDRMLASLPDEDDDF